MNPQLNLYDDGTLDTVFECSACNRLVRYSDFPRDEYGDLAPNAWEEAENEHLEECDMYDFFEKETK